MMQKIKQFFKEEIKIKDILLWFLLSFVGVFVVFVVLNKQSISSYLLIEIFGFALVFVALMIGTKAYGQFVDGFYQERIDAHEKKANRKNK